MRSNPQPSPPPEAWNLLARLARAASRPLERFLRIEAASGIVLLLAAAVALASANSPWASGYASFWQTPVALRVSTFQFVRTLEWCVNDGLMVVFFFVVGMEIRRELYDGALAEWRRAALPAVAALGGMLVPAALYLSVASGRATHAGWGVPMATDIAFAVGILALLGSRVPPGLRVVLLALAVIDDLGAIVVIALFYSAGLAFEGFALAALGFASIGALKSAGVRSKAAYVLPALVAWAGIYASGVHPTIAGVLVGLMTPVREARGEAVSPAASLIEMLHPWVAFVIMPVFALANAGVSLSGGSFDANASRVAFGVVLGLVVGKPVGVCLAVWLTLRLRIGALPEGLNFRHVIVLGVVAGVGFTMALFVAQLAFADAALLAAAKAGVLLASGVAGLLSLLLGRVLLSRPAGGVMAAAPSGAG